MPLRSLAAVSYGNIEFSIKSYELRCVKDKPLYNMSQEDQEECREFCKGVHYLKLEPPSDKSASEQLHYELIKLVLAKDGFSDNMIKKWWFVLEGK
jgi:hypothetical protein